MRKSNQPVDLKGPPEVRKWFAMDPAKDGSPCVIKRRFTYWQTNLKRLSKAEENLKAYKERPPNKQKPELLLALREKVANRKLWVEFSVETLRNSTRFARARISPEGDDYKALMDRCPKCGEDASTLDKSGHATAFVSARLGNRKSEVRCVSCCNSEPAEKLTYDVKRRPRGRANKSIHKTLHYYDAVLDSFIWAKKAAAGNSLSDDALEHLLKLVGKTIGHFKNQTAREREDAEQQAIMGLLEAARKFDPAKSNLAKFTTYASFWVRRRTQARKTSHCKPGLAIIKGKVKADGLRFEMNDSEEGRSDRYHPGAASVNLPLQLDVKTALNELEATERAIVVAHLINRETLATLTERHNIPVSKIRAIIASASAKLAERLAAHNPTGDLI